MDRLFGLGILLLGRGFVLTPKELLAVAFFASVSAFGARAITFASRRFRGLLIWRLGARPLCLLLVPAAP